MCHVYLQPFGRFVNVYHAIVNSCTWTLANVITDNEFDVGDECQKSKNVNAWLSEFLSYKTGCGAATKQRNRGGGRAKDHQSRTGDP